jgi:ABC-type lipopolysaccharide export system ATPase subunit
VFLGLSFVLQVFSGILILIVLLFKKVNNFIENYAIGILIVGGDLNDTLTGADRKYSISTQKTKKPVNSLKTFFYIVGI